MSQPSCDACTTLREYAPEFVMNGVTDYVAASLKNNTGLNPAVVVNHRNCEDLNDVNDCLIGRLGQELEGLDVCDWKEFMDRLMPNLYETLKAMIMSDCGAQSRIDCVINALRSLYSAKSFTIPLFDISVDPPVPDPRFKFRSAKGVSVLNVSTSIRGASLSVMGGRAWFGIGLEFDGSMPSNYGSGSWASVSSINASSKTNEFGESWGGDGQCITSPLICEFQIRGCDYGLHNIWIQGELHEGTSGIFRMRITSYRSGQTVPPDASATAAAIARAGYVFAPSDPEMVLIQIRLINTIGNFGHVSPNGHFDIIPCINSIADC